MNQIAVVISQRSATNDLSSLVRLLSCFPCCSSSLSLSQGVSYFCQFSALDEPSPCSRKFHGRAIEINHARGASPRYNDTHLRRRLFHKNCWIETLRSAAQAFVTRFITTESRMKADSVNWGAIQLCSSVTTSYENARYGNTKRRHCHRVLLQQSLTMAEPSIPGSLSS